MSDRSPTAAQLALYERACELRERAYVPYSHFPVGAVLRRRGWPEFEGVNVENGSYGLTICAERIGLRARRRRGRPPLHARSASPPTTRPRTGSPCGACRQFLSEFGLDLIVVYRREGEVVAEPLSALLPAAFELRELTAQRLHRPRRTPERRQVDAHERALRLARRDRLRQAADDPPARARRRPRRGLPDRARRPPGLPEAVRRAHAAHAALRRHEPRRRRCRAARARRERGLGRRRPLHRGAARGHGRARRDRAQQGRPAQAGGDPRGDRGRLRPRRRLRRAAPGERAHRRRRRAS